jgi:hypothetical protein
MATNGRVMTVPDLPDGVFWIASYPKSGNTWMRILLSNLMAGTDEPEDINSLRISVGIAGARHMFEDESLVETQLLRHSEIETLRPLVHDSYARSRKAATFVKVHDAWTRLADGTPTLGRAARGAIYLVRDPRDVAVSLAAFDSRPTDDVIDQLNREGEAVGETDAQIRQIVNSWSGHVQSWLDHASIPVIVIRYEDLLRDTAGEFRRALSFLGAEFPDVEISRAVRNSDFRELQRQEKAQGFRERGRRQDVLTRNNSFFREGRSEQWRSALTADQIHRIEQTNRATMSRLGYSLATFQENAA